MKPIIGIVGRVAEDNDNDKVICCYEDVRIAVIKKGGIPLLILPTQSYYLKNKIDMTDDEKEDLIKIIDKCGGIIIPGGYNWYQFDEFIYSYAYKKDIPILGICLGMQMMTLMNNGNSLDITEKNNTINHHKKNEKYVHSIKIKENTYLYNIIKKKEIRVNSRHNYHIPKVFNLDVSAYSEDGLIEAVEDINKRFVLGVQWHPESMIDYDDSANKLFEEFINKCSK